MINDLRNKLIFISENILQRKNEEEIVDILSFDDINTLIHILDGGNHKLNITSSIDELNKSLKSEPDNILNYLFQASSLLNSKNILKSDKCGSFYADTRPCSEDCSFCPLSKDHYEGINTDRINWKDISESIFNFANEIYSQGVKHFKVVTTGAKSDSKIVPYIAKGVKKVKDKFQDMVICISEGTLDRESLKLLKKSGVDIFNNNLETSRSRFPSIVTSHSYDEKIRAIKTAKELEFRICSGGLFGIGESLKERIELAYTLKELGVDSSPINIFVPFEKLPLTKKLKENNYILTKREIFISIALFRLINPDIRYVLGAGRRDFFTEEEQLFCLLIGVSAFASSGYLAKEGVINSSLYDDKIFSKYFK